MKVAISIDSLKGSLSSMEAGEAIKDGILRVYQNADVVVSPLADGGEGTVEALTCGMDGQLRTILVTGPLGEMVNCAYGIVDNGRTAVIEMARAAGITLISESERNPLVTTTYGVGEVIIDAINEGCRKFIIGIGGSATNDGGVGMLQALGYDFLDDSGNQIERGAKGLENLHRIEDIHVIQELKECEFRVACDVTNPLCGETGSSAVYSMQKGASLRMIPLMDQWLENYARISKLKYAKADPDYPGAGAAGGMGFAFMNFTNAVLESGIDIVLEETKFERNLEKADIIITGEGQLDRQTTMGKAPIGVANLAKKYDKKVIAFSGSVTDDAKSCNIHGIDAFFPILRSIVTLEEAMDPVKARANLTDAVEQVFRLICVCNDHQ